MRRNSIFPIIICMAFIVAGPLIAENLWDVVEEAQNTIYQKYPSESSIARSMALDELKRIAGSDLSDEQKIEEIHKKFSSITKKQVNTAVQPTNHLDLIYRPILQWTIHSIEIAYEVDNSTNILLSMESLYQEEERNSREDSTGESNTKTTNNGNRTQRETQTGVSTSFSLNIFNWFKPKAEFQWVNDHHSGKETSATESTQWNERAQRAWNKLYEEKAQILQNTKISNCHLTFSISFKNNTNSDLVFTPQNVSVPVYAGNELLTNAVPNTSLQTIQIPGNAYADVMFRAELNTSSSLKLISYMRTNEPLIRLERGQFSITSLDGKIQNAIQESVQVETIPIRCRDMELRVLKRHQGKPTTVSDALHALNAVFEKPPFGFNNGGDCVSLMDIALSNPGDKNVNLEQFPVITANGEVYSAPIPVSKLSLPLSEEGISFDVVSLFDEGEKNPWEEASASLQKHYVSYLKPFAEQDNADAQYQLGNCLLHGLGLEEDKNEAVKWFCRAAEQGLKQAQIILSICFGNDTFMNKDNGEALKWIQKMAEQGLPQAQYELGCFYYKGKGVSENKKVALKWFQNAAEQGLNQAQDILFILSHNDKEIKQEEKDEAVEWLREIAEQGLPQAQYDLGYCYYYGKGVSENKKEAIKWIHKAADYGLLDALNLLGLCYNEGKAVTQDDAEALKYFRMAAEQGHADAQAHLGVYYFWGMEINKNQAEAVRFFRMAAEQGHSEAQYALGFCLCSGIGVAKDVNVGIEMIRNAAENGSPSLQVAVGELYEFGVLPLVLPSQGRISTKNPSLKLHIDPYFVFEEIKEISQDKDEAAKWYRMAAEQGNGVAKKGLERLGY